MTSPTYLRLLSEAPEAFPQPQVRERGSRLTWATLFHADTVAVEFMLATLSILCGIWVLLPFDMFTMPFPVIHKYFSEPACGAWLLGIGALRLGVLWRGKVKYRQILAFLAFVTWLNLLAWAIITDPQRMSVVFFVVLSLSSFWIFLRGPSRIQHRVAARHDAERRDMSRLAAMRRKRMR